MSWNSTSRRSVALNKTRQCMVGNNVTSVTAYIDEAGNLTDVHDRFVVVTAIVTSPDIKLRFIIPKARRKLKHTKLKRHKGREVKWANSSEALQRRVSSN